MIGSEERLQKLIERQSDMLGNASSNDAITATLRVSPNGSGADGLSWRTAYQTIQAALDAASTDGDDCTLILVSPHATHYDIATAGDPSWSANVIIKGTHRNWAKVMNSVGDSIMTLTGKSAVIDMNFNVGVDLDFGLKVTHGGARVYSCQFVGEDLTSGPCVALWLDHASGGKHAKVIDCDFVGHATNMIGVYIDEFGYSNFERLRIHSCAVGIGFTGASSDKNILEMCDIGECLIGLDIDEGNEQHFHDIILHHNTVNVDDEVGDHIWTNIFGSFAIKVLPDDFTGVNVPTHGTANTWTAAPVAVYTNATGRPFRVVGVHVLPAESQFYRLKFTDGTTYYDDLLFNATKREGVAAPSGTEYIFNKGTVISAVSKCPNAGPDALSVWLEIQEI